MLDIQPSLLAFEIIVFLLLVAILNQILYKPLLAFMQERNAGLKADTNLVSSQDAEREQLLKDADAILINAKAEAGKIMHEALTAAKAEAQQKLDEIKKQEAEQLNIFESELASEQAVLSDTIKAHAGEYTQSLAKVLKV